MRLQHKTTGHIASLAILVALALAFPSVSKAGEIRLTTSNDLLSRDGGDDLYTAALELELGNESGRVLLGERMFTDRARGVRHDETFVEIGRDLPTRGGWQTEVRAGLLRVGRGLAGQAVQNEVHRWVGADPVELDYTGDNDLFASLGARSTSSLGRWGETWFDSRVEAYTAPGFRSWVRAEIVAERALAPELAVRARAGARIDDVETARLAPYVAGSGWSAGISVSWRRLSLGWSRNDDGTATQHVTFGVRIGPRAPGADQPRD